MSAKIGNLSGAAGVRFHLRLMVAVMLTMALTVTAVVVWDNARHRELQTRNIDYHLATELYCAEIQRALTALERQLDAYRAGSGASPLNANQRAALIERLDEASYILSHNQPGIVELQARFRDQEFTAAVDNVRSSYANYRRVAEELAGQIAGFEALLRATQDLKLRVEQLRRLHTLGRDELRRTQTQEQRVYRYALAATVLVFLVLGLLSVRSFVRRIFRAYDEQDKVKTALQSLAHGVAAEHFDDFLCQCARNLVSLYGVRYASISLLEQPGQTRMHTLVMLDGDTRVDNLSYDLKGTPCRDVLRNKIDLLPDGATARYPEDRFLKDKGIESYYGATLVGPDDNVLGVVAVMDTKALRPREWMRSVLGVYAERIAIEIGRKETDALLRQHRDELEAVVTERTRDLVAATENAIRANSAKTEFLSRMSHELRTPLNAILGFAQLLDLQHDLKAQQHDNVKEILHAGEHLLALINEVLDLTRIESGKVDISLAPVSTQRVLEDSLRLVRPIAAQREVTLRVHSASDCNPYVMAEYTRLKEVLLNLLTNAVKYNHHGGTVTVSCETMPDGLLRIWVSDTGRGLSKDQQSLLFVPFARLGAEYSDVEGTGIGLTISQRLVEMMNGHIGFESEPGVGSRFYVELPQAERPAAAED